MARFSFLLLGVLGLVSCGESGSVTVTSEPAGENCEAGGVRIEQADSTVDYVCDGMSGTNGTNGTDGAGGVDGTPGADGVGVTISEEPAGPNCEAGGVRIETTEGAVNYVCDAPAPGPSVSSSGIELCPGEGAFAPDPTSFLRLTGTGPNGDITGDALFPTPGESVEVVASCWGGTAELQRRTYDPFVFVKQVDSASVDFIEAAAQNASLALILDNYVPDGADFTSEYQVTLTDARVVKVEHFVAPVVGTASQLTTFERITLTYRELRYKQGLNEATITDPIIVPDRPSMVTCPVNPNAATYFLSLDDGLSIPGDAMSTLFPEAIEVYGYCWELERRPQETAVRSGPVRIIKGVDRASPSILEAFVQGAQLTAALNHIGFTAEADEELRYTKDVRQGRITAFSAISKNGVSYEEVALSHLELEYTHLPSAKSVIINQAAF